MCEWNYNLDSCPKDNTIVLLAVIVDLNRGCLEHNEVFEGKWNTTQEKYTGRNGFLIFEPYAWALLPDGPRNPKQIAARQKIKDLALETVKTIYDRTEGEWLIRHMSIVETDMRKTIREEFPEFCWVCKQDYSYEGEVRAFVKAIIDLVP